MLTTLSALKRFLSREPAETPQQPHDQLEHEHWDRIARTWRRHPDAIDEDRDAA